MSATNRLSGSGKYEALLDRCRGLDPVPTAVAHPCEETALAGAIDAAAQGLIQPTLVGPGAKIRDVAKAAGIALDQIPIVDALHSQAAAVKAVELVRCGEAELLMKGSLHSDELLAAVVARETGLRTGRRVSHVFILDVPTYHKVMVVTDAAIWAVVSTKDVDWQIWIAQGERPYPCRYVITSTQVSRAPAYTIDLRDWKTDAVAPASFAFKAPANARKLNPGELKDFDELPAIFKIVKDKRAGLELRLLPTAVSEFFVSTVEAVVGRPLTPVSVSGVARRTARRCSADVYDC